MNTFISGVKTAISAVVAAANGQDYVSWPVAVALGGRPAQRPVLFEGTPAFEIFGGLVVAVDMDLPGGQVQRTWLPLLDSRNNPVAASQATSREISDAINRVRAKAMAMVAGVSLCLYAGEKDAGKFLKELAVKPDSDLASVQPVEDKKPGGAGAAYVSWAHALCAVRLTDPDFHWEVVHQEVTDPTTGEVRSMPYIQCGNTFIVAVQATYKSTSHTEYLPIMGQVKGEDGKRRDHVALVNPTSADWNRAVMRCLTKAIAVVSGYGLSTYAGEDLADLVPVQVGRKPQAPTQDWPAPTAASVPAEVPPTTSAASPAPTTAVVAESAPTEPAATVAEPAPADKASVEATTTAAEVTPAVEHSPKLTQAIARLSTISDLSRLKKAMEAAPGLFGSEAPVFVNAVKARLAVLAVPEAAAEA